MSYTWEYQEVLIQRKLESEIVTEFGECKICGYPLDSNAERRDRICNWCRENNKPD